MSCLRKLWCFRPSKVDQATAVVGETSPARQDGPRNPAPSRDTPIMRRRGSEPSAPQLSPSAKSASSESNWPTLATEYLSSSLNDITTPANLCTDFLKGFEIADHSVLGDELQDVSGTNGAGPHAGLSGLKSDGRNESEADQSTARPKSAELAASPANAPAVLGPETSSPSDGALSAGWIAANTSVTTEGISSAGNAIS
jgi:hypothetical protein